MKTETKNLILTSKLSGSLNLKLNSHWKASIHRRDSRLYPNKIPATITFPRKFSLHRCLNFYLDGLYTYWSSYVYVQNVSVALHRSNKRRIIPQRKYESTYDITCGNNRDIWDYRRMRTSFEPLLIFHILECKWLLIWRA